MSFIYVLVTIIIFGGNDIFLRFVQTSEGENRLVHYLFSEQGYNPLVRPTQYSNETVVISFGLLLVQLIHVNIYKDTNIILLIVFIIGLWKRTDYENKYMVTYEMVCLKLKNVWQ